MKYTLLFIPLIFFSCSELSGNEKVLLNKKWYMSNKIAIEFKEDYRYLIHYSKDSIVQHTYEFLDSETLKITDKKQNSTRLFYDVKDSVLLLVYIDKKDKVDNTFDSVFLHQNPRYEDWQSREIYYYGNIYSKQDPRPVPFVYFQF